MTTRYEFSNRYGMNPKPKGDYVLHDDHVEELEEANEALRLILSTQEEEGLCDNEQALSQIYLIAEKALNQ